MISGFWVSCSGLEEVVLILRFCISVLPCLPGTAGACRSAWIPACHWSGLFVTADTATTCLGTWVVSAVLGLPFCLGVLGLEVEIACGCLPFCLLGLPACRYRFLFLPACLHRVRYYHRSTCLPALDAVLPATAAILPFCSGFSGKQMPACHRFPTGCVLPLPDSACTVLLLPAWILVVLPFVISGCACLPLPGWITGFHQILPRSACRSAAAVFCRCVDSCLEHMGAVPALGLLDFCLLTCVSGSCRAIYTLEFSACCRSFCRITAACLPPFSAIYLLYLPPAIYHLLGPAFPAPYRVCRACVSFCLDYTACVLRFAVTVFVLDFLHRR